MKILKDILYKVNLEAVNGSTNVAVSNLHFDSRKVALNDVFFAIKGTLSDGHDYIDQAINQGALVVVCQKMPQERVNGVTYIQVNDSHKALAIVAANFYGNPSENLKLVGVTGTNGKTTVASLLYHLFKDAGYEVGLLSTVDIRVGDHVVPAQRTTPDPITINHYLLEMNNAGVEYCFMEVSSHGIAQERTSGLQFSGGIFTNLSHDHLDYHPTFAAYRDVKKRFFDELPAGAFALVNADDKNGPVMLQNTKARKVTYALKSAADYKAKVLESEFNGQLLKIEDQEVWTKLIGTFNAYNVLAIYAAADLLGLNRLENLKHLSGLEPVNGRFQYFTSIGGVHAIVDYAHTPDALENVLNTINSIRTKNEELITVVGCGGDRDKSKRPKMGNIASSLSTKVIFTNDNPRTEDPEKILAEVEGGVQPQHYNKMLSIANRRQAIKTAVQMSGAGDIILIAGKGHETYQEINNERKDFDDLKIVKELLIEAGK